MAKRKTLKPLMDALDLDIGSEAPIATLRTKLAALRQQAEALESDCEMAEAERDDFKTKLEQAKLEISSLENQLAQWQQPKSDEQRLLEDFGAWPGN
jgi:chromosome segregation ATPase